MVLTIVSLELICSKSRENGFVIFNVVESVGEVESKNGSAGGSGSVANLGIGQHRGRVLAVFVGAGFQFDVVGGAGVVDRIILARGGEGGVEECIEDREKFGLGLCAGMVVGGEGSHLWIEQIFSIQNSPSPSPCRCEWQYVLDEEHTNVEDYKSCG